jgi:procollagen-lysine,2-oxoglutarate 5-dioxygenase, invertebrate
LDELIKIVTHKSVDNMDDDQLYYTNIFLDKELREKLKISLDHNSEVFQNLNGAYGRLILNCDALSM